MLQNEQTSWIRPEERSFLRRAEELVLRVKTSSNWLLSDFLSPREQEIIRSVAGHAGLQVEFFGGYAEAERKRARIMPDNWYPEPSDFEVAKLLLTSSGGREFSHGEILGSVLGLGIDRRVMGDIGQTNEGQCVFVTREMASYLRDHLHQVGREAVHIDDVHTELAVIPPAYEEQTLFVASLRADAVVSHVCRLSRAKAQALFQQKRIQLNHTIVGRTDEQVYLGDLISVRGFGRIRVGEIEGTTKKDRIRLRVDVLLSTKR